MQRHKGTERQRDRAEGFSALCLCHFVPLSLKLSVSVDSAGVLFVPLW